MKRALALLLFVAGCNAVLDNDPVHLADTDELAPEPATGVDGEAAAPSEEDAEILEHEAEDAGPPPCTDPRTCACTPSDPPLTEACGDCGQLSYTCVSGKWQASEGCRCSTITELGEACGAGGTLTRTCGDDCRWSAPHCDQPPANDAGLSCPHQDPGSETRACACGLGTQSRVRTWSTASCAYGAWSDWGACTGASESCTPGQVESADQSCGSCGAGSQRRTRTCGTDCKWLAWGLWSECSGSAQCMPQQQNEESRACGACGAGAQTRTRSCEQSCSWSDWSAWGECTGGATACTPGELDSETMACGACSGGTMTRTRVCSQGCTWGEWSTFSVCSGSGGVCTPGQTESSTKACGGCNVGTQTRTRVCSSECAWGEWSAYGACDAVAACAPGQGQSEKEVCGLCGTGSRARTRSCTDSCTWSAWSAWGTCSGVTGVCTPNTKKSTRRTCAACGIGNATDTQTCSASCQWGPVVAGSCVTPSNYCNPDANDGYACRGTGRREWCFVRGSSQQCTYGAADSEACSRTYCPDCY